MPDRYDRAECATELRLRAEILEKIRRGWRPAAAFETPVSPGMRMQQLDEKLVKNEKSAPKDAPSDSETSETSETSLPENIADLDDYV